MKRVVRFLLAVPFGIAFGLYVARVMRRWEGRHG